MIVSGRNLDSEARDNKNGVGKSVLLGTLPNLRYEADPLSLTKRNKKAMVEKDSLIEFEWEHDGKTIVASQTSSKYHVVIDGDDLEVHKSKQEVGRQHIESMFPMSETAFYTIAYLHSQRSNMFQYAKPAERMAYLIEMYDMHIYDKLRAYFSTKATEARKQAQEAEVISGELQVAQAKLSSVAVDPRKVDRALANYEAASTELLSCMDDLNAVRIELSNSEQRAKLKARLSELDLGVDNPEEELRRIESLYDQVVAYEHYTDKLRDYNDECADIDSRISSLSAGLKEGDDMDTCAARFNEVDARLSEIEELLDQEDTRLERFEELSADIDHHKSGLGDTPDVTLDECIDGLAMCKATINLAREFEDQISDRKASCLCPTCQSKVDVKSLALSVKRATADKKRFEEYREHYKALDIIASLEEELASISKPIAPKKALMREGAALSKESKSLSTTLSLLERLDKIQRQRESLRAPKPVAKPKTRKTQDELRAAGKALTRFIELSSQYAKLPVCRPASALRKLERQLDAESKDLTERAQKLNDLYTKLNYKLMSFNDAKSTVARLEERIEKLRPSIEKLRLFELMQKAYASTNLKASAVEGVLKMLEIELNALHSLTFPEPMEFSLSVKNGGVEAIVTRVSSGRPSDLSKLSGAESNCFSLLWAYVMLVFTPAEKRPSFIILDEPDHLCSPGLREHLIREFLPKLMDIVPHVFWITPQDPELFGDAHRWIVEKKNGYSQVLEG